MKILNLIIIFIFLNINAANAVINENNEYNFLKSKTQIKDPYSMRDPFKKKIATKKGRAKAKERAKGVFDNTSESIEAKHTDSIRIVGIIIGKERRAMATVAGSKETFILKEGMKIGVTGAEVKAILPGGVVLVEKIKNIYDQEEYLETVLPISSN